MNIEHGAQLTRITTFRFLPEQAQRGTMKPERRDHVILLDTPDDVLVERVLAGRPEAQLELVRRYGRLIASVMANILGARADLSDLLQEAYLIAFRDLHKLREPGALKYWLISIAVSRAQNQLRSERRKWWLSFRAPEDLPARASSPEEDDAVRAVYEALSQMSPDARTIFALRFITEMTIPEVAMALELSESTAKRRLSKARKTFDALVADDPRLRAWLGHRGDA